MDNRGIITKENKVITTKEARKLLGSKYANIGDDVIDQLIKELEQLAEIQLGFP